MPNISYIPGDLVYATALNDRSDRPPRYPAIVVDDDVLMIFRVYEDKPSSARVYRNGYSLFPMNEDAVRLLTYELKLVADAVLVTLGLPSPFQAQD